MLNCAKQKTLKNAQVGMGVKKFVILLQDLVKK